MKYIFFLSFVFLSLFVSAQPPDWLWAKSAKGNGHDYGISISNDATGNCYATGYFQVPIVIFDNCTLTGPLNSHDNYYFVKYNYEGNIVWARTAKGKQNVYGRSVKTDIHGNSYVGGNYNSSDTIIFNNDTLFPYPNIGGMADRAFLAKYDSSGNVLWVKSAGDIEIGGDPYRTLQVEIDSKGNSYITGNFGDFYDSLEAFILKKYNTSGNLVWQKSVLSQNYSGSHNCSGICSDNKGNIYITGTFANSSLTFSNITIPYIGDGNNIYIAKYDSSGNIKWAKSTGTKCYFPRIAADADQNCYITGFFYGNHAVFDSITITSPSYCTIFLVKLDSLGNVAWAKGFGQAAMNASESRDIIIDAEGNIYFTGYFSSMIIFDNISLISTGFHDLFVAKYNNAGNAIWAQRAGGTMHEHGLSISLNTEGYLFVTGDFTSTESYFGNSTLINTDIWDNSYEIFIGKLNNTTGIREVSSSALEITIFPNPSNGLFNVVSSFIVKELKITDLLGHTIYYLLPERQNFSFKFDKTGIFFITFTSDKNNETRKLIRSN